MFTSSNLPSSSVPSPAKKQKLLIDMASSINQAVTNVMEGTAKNSHQSRSIPKFKFWENILDGLKFLYDHLYSEGDIAKVKSVDPQQLTANLESHLIWRAMIVGALFEAGDESDKAERIFPKR